MKLPCKHCGDTPKYKYGYNIYNGDRHVILQCSCGNATRICKSDPTALKYWNDDNGADTATAPNLFAQSIVGFMMGRTKFQ